MKKILLTLIALVGFVSAKAQTDPIKVTFTTSDFTYEWYDMGEDGSFWYFGCTDDSGDYEVRLAYNTESQTGTVKYGDLNQSYTYLQHWTDKDNYESEDITFQEGSEFTISEEDGYVVVRGTVIGNDGNTYTLDGKCQLPLPETYDIEGNVITMASYAGNTENDWEVRFKNDDWKIVLNVNAKEGGAFAGTYTIDDACTEGYGCYAEDLNEDEDYTFTEMNVTVTMPEGITDPKVACEITGTAKDAKGNTFNFHMKKDAPIQPKEVKNIEVEVATAEWPSETTGGAYYEVTEKDKPENKWILSLTEKTGECTTEQFGGIDTTATYRVNTTTEEQLHVNNGTIKQELNAESLEIEVQAQLVMNDSIQYNFTFTTPATKKGEQEIKFTDLQVDRSYEDYGTVCLNASTDEIQMYVQLTDYPDIPGEYTSDNCEPQLTTFADGEFTYINSLALVYARTEQAEGDAKPTFEAKFLADNHILYTIEASYEEPKVEKDTTIVATPCQFGGDEDGHYYTYEDEHASIWIKTLGADIAGHFTINEIDGNSKISMYSPKGMPRDYYLSKADFTVTVKDTVYVLEGTCQAGPYNVKLRMKYKMEGLDNDNFKEDVDVTYTLEDKVEITADDESSSLYVKLLSKPRGDEVCLRLYPEHYASGMTEIPAGEYNFATDDWAPYAEAGTTDETGVYPSYYAKLDATGQLQTPMWFMTSGTIVVNEDGSIEITAQNSYNRNIKIVYTNTTGIDVVMSGSKGWNGSNGADGKFIKNGEVVIRNGNSTWNVKGQKR